LPQTPCFPFAWLPLTNGEQQFGILALTYPHLHHFSEEEKRIVNMFASQCAAAMDNAQTTVALRMAYERSQEELRIVQTEYERTSTATSQAIKIFYSME